MAGTVIAVPPAAANAVAAAIGDGLARAGLGNELGEGRRAVGPSAFGAGIFRTTDRVDSDIAGLGTWFEQQTNDLPEWLAPFNGRAWWPSTTTVGPSLGSASRSMIGGARSCRS